MHLPLTDAYICHWRFPAPVVHNYSPSVYEHAHRCQATQNTFSNHYRWWQCLLLIIPTSSVHLPYWGRMSWWAGHDWPRPDCTPHSPADPTQSACHTPGPLSTRSCDLSMPMHSDGYGENVKKIPTGCNGYEWWNMSQCEMGTQTKKCQHCICTALKMTFKSVENQI